MQREKKREREKRERETEKEKQKDKIKISQQRQASGTQRVNAVIRSAAALRAPLTSLQNVKKNPRTLPQISQNIGKYQKGSSFIKKSSPGIKKVASETK